MQLVPLCTSPLDQDVDVNENIINERFDSAKKIYIEYGVQSSLCQRTRSQVGRTICLTTLRRTTKDSVDAIEKIIKERFDIAD
jgi:hypothetical protein